MLSAYQAATAAARCSLDNPVVVNAVLFVARQTLSPR